MKKFKDLCIGDSLYILKGFNITEIQCVYMSSKKKGKLSLSLSWGDEYAIIDSDNLYINESGGYANNSIYNIYPPYRIFVNKIDAVERLKQNIASTIDGKITSIYDTLNDIKLIRGEHFDILSNDFDGIINKIEKSLRM